MIFSSYEPFCNTEGCIRLKLVRDAFGLNFESKNLDVLVSLYKTWRDTVELMPMRLTFLESKYIDLSNTSSSADKWIEYYTNEFKGWNAVRFNDVSEVVCYEGKSYEWKYFKSCKRGNDVYIKKVKKRFKNLIDSKKLPKAWKVEVNSKRKRVRKCKLLYITGTVSQTSGAPPVVVKHSICDRWINFGEYWNSFITNIREQFNGAEYIRVWQSQENGYPHFHAIVYFPNYWFSAVKNKEFNEKKNKWEYVWRVHNKQKKNGKYVRDSIKDAWKVGWLDVKCCDDTRKALKDLKKYVTRDLEGGESDLTNAMVWFYRKRAFSVSKGFEKTFGKSIAEPSDADLINASGVIQRSNSKKKLLMIEIFPLVKRENLDFGYQKMVDDVENVPDPPPNVVDYFENLADSCEVVKVNKKVFEDGSVFDVVLYKKKRDGF